MRMVELENPVTEKDEKDLQDRSVSAAENWVEEE